MELVAVISMLQTFIPINACRLEFTPYSFNCTLVDTLPLIQTASTPFIRCIGNKHKFTVCSRKSNIDSEDNFDFSCSNSAWCAGVHSLFSLFYVKFVNKIEE